MADRPISKQEWEFLPENLSKDFATEARKDTTVQKTMAEVYPTKTRYIKLVDSTFYLIPVQADHATESESITPFR